MSRNVLSHSISKEYREELIDAYTYALVEDMDVKTLCSIASEYIKEKVNLYTDEELIDEIAGRYPDLV